MGPEQMYRVLLQLIHSNSQPAHTRIWSDSLKAAAGKDSRCGKIKNFKKINESGKMCYFV